MTGELRPRRILIVDDAGETRSILAIALQTIADTVVEVAGSAEEALALIAGQPIDLLITDVHMPGMDGLEFLERLRQAGHWPPAGALVISGETDPDLPRGALEAGAAAFIPKPFSVVEVRKTVVALLGA